MHVKRASCCRDSCTWNGRDATIAAGNKADKLLPWRLQVEPASYSHTNGADELLP